MGHHSRGGVRWGITAEVGLGGALRQRWGWAGHHGRGRVRWGITAEVVLGGASQQR